MQENIFAPLGMKDSGYDQNSTVVVRRASGYSLSAGGFQNANYIHMSIPHAAGGLYSTTEDLLRWVQGLFGGKLLSARSLERMTTPFKGDYGLGLCIETTRGRKRFFHAGGIEGFNTFLAYYPESRIASIALANVDGVVSANEIASQLGTLAHGDTSPTFSDRQGIEVRSEILAGYVGTYRSANGASLSVTLTGSQLMAQRSGLSTVALMPTSETTFVMKEMGDRLEFVRGPEGTVTDVIWYTPSVDRSRTYSRIKEPEDIGWQTSIVMPCDIPSDIASPFREHG
jgi:hypothetical protein